MEVHNCIHCGTESQPTWRFCRRCGTALENLDQLPAVAHCANCSSPVAEGWRFCANCGTGTDSATAANAGLSEDAVADLIATPGATDSKSAAPAAEPESPAIADSPDLEPQPPQPQQAATEPQQAASEVASAPAPAAPATGSAETATPDLDRASEEPMMSAPQVSFEPAAAVPDADSAEDDGSPPPVVAAELSPPPPPPPPQPLTDSENMASRFEAEAPPPAPGAASSGPQAEIIEPEEDPFSSPTEAAEAIEIGEEVVAAAVDDSREPAVTIPHRDEEPQIRSAVPRPIGDDTIPPTGVPKPLDRTREEREAPVAGDEPKRRVAVPERDRPTAETEEDELPPLDGHFRNPGLLGQGVQLLLIASAALAVAMMVALIVLNNRLDAYATSGESLARVQSAESMVNTWMRPLLIFTIVVTYALLAMWSRRVVDNLEAFHNGMEETPLWMWLMPIVNMWVLFRHLDLAWKGSDYYARGARTWQRSVPDVWTVLFVLLPTLGFVLVLYAWVNGADSFSMAIDSNAFSVIGYFAIAIGLLAGVRSISNIIDRQRTRAEGLR